MKSNNQNKNQSKPSIDVLFLTLFPTTEPGIDLKLLTHKRGRIGVGESLSGEIVRDGEEHFTFTEGWGCRMTKAAKRNPCVLYGTYINVHRNDAGELYPTFNHPRYTKKFTFRHFCIKAAEELLSVASLIEEGDDR